MRRQFPAIERAVFLNNRSERKISVTLGGECKGQSHIALNGLATVAKAAD
jgi:general stress protein 26